MLTVEHIILKRRQANKTLHLTTIPQRSIAAGELDRSQSGRWALTRFMQYAIGV